MIEPAYCATLAVFTSTLQSLKDSRTRYAVHIVPRYTAARSCDVYTKIQYVARNSRNDDVHGRHIVRALRMRIVRPSVPYNQHRFLPPECGAESLTAVASEGRVEEGSCY